MRSIKQKRRKSKRLGRTEGRNLATFLTEDMDTKVVMTQALIPLGLMAVNEMLQQEVESAGSHATIFARNDAGMVR